MYEDEVYAALGIIVVVTLVALFFATIVKIISRWIFFNKCKESGWKSLIPIYTDITLIKISGLNWWWILIIYFATFISSFNLVNNMLSETEVITTVPVVVALLSVLSMVSSLASTFARFNLCYNLSKKFNQNIGYAFLIFFFEPIMFFVLGLSSSFEYDENADVSPNGVLGASAVSSSATVAFCMDCGSQLSKGDMYCQNCGKKVK